MTKPTANPRLYLLLGIALVALLAVLVFGDRLFGGGSAQPPGYVSRAMLGDQWPLTVEDGVLACTGSGGTGAVTFTAGGTMYAVNGVARQSASSGADIAPIWAADASGAKRDLGPLIEKGLALCR